MYINDIGSCVPGTIFSSQRIAVPLYYADSINHCPSCGHTHWHIGRVTAECAFCNDAIPMARSAFPITVDLVAMDELAV